MSTKTKSFHHGSGELPAPTKGITKDLKRLAGKFRSPFRLCLAGPRKPKTP